MISVEIVILIVTSVVGIIGGLIGWLQFLNNFIRKKDLEKEVIPIVYSVVEEEIKKNNATTEKDVKIALSPIIASITQLQSHIDGQFQIQNEKIDTLKQTVESHSKVLNNE